MPEYYAAITPKVNVHPTLLTIIHLFCNLRHPLVMGNADILKTCAEETVRDLHFVRLPEMPGGISDSARDDCLHLVAQCSRCGNRPTVPSVKS